MRSLNPQGGVGKLIDGLPHLKQCIQIPAVTPSPRVADFPTILDFPAPHLNIYPKETVVAEKFEAMGETR